MGLSTPFSLAYCQYICALACPEGARSTHPPYHISGHATTLCQVVPNQVMIGYLGNEWKCESLRDEPLYISHLLDETVTAISSCKRIYVCWYVHIEIEHLPQLTSSRLLLCELQTVGLFRSFCNAS